MTSEQLIPDDVLSTIEERAALILAVYDLSLPHQRWAVEVLAELLVKLGGPDLTDLPRPAEMTRREQGPA